MKVVSYRIASTIIVYSYSKAHLDAGKVRVVRRIVNVVSAVRKLTVALVAQNTAHIAQIAHTEEGQSELEDATAGQRHAHNEHREHNEEPDAARLSCAPVDLLVGRPAMPVHHFALPSHCPPPVMLTRNLGALLTIGRDLTRKGALFESGLRCKFETEF